MADKKKMSVADILAAARKADAQGGQGATPDPGATAESERAPEAVAPEETAASAAPETSPPSDVDESPKSPPAKVPASGSGRPNVADILAAARAEKKPAAAAPAKAKPAPKPAPKPAAPKAAAATATATKPTAAKAAPKETGPLDTQSILAAVRGGKKPGPMTKAEAAAKTSPAAPAAKKAKEAIVVPPMPVKPDYAKPREDRSKQEAAERRAFILGLSALATGFVALSGTLALWTLGTVRFMFPNVLREPPSNFKVGFPDQFAPGQVETKYKAQFGVWVVNTAYNGEQQLFALKSVCTHLGCTPNWLEAEQKFKCPCHGSGFYKDGINFEGPAPRPLERYAIAIADDGQVEIDKSRTFQEEMGHWADASSYIPV